ncbi:MAG TPA: SIP domain-containing protein [Gryllotalpicola sp.]
MASRHHDPVGERVLIAGDQHDLEAIRHVLALLPDEAYGQVFVEVLDEREVIALDAPPRITVTWLTRVTRGSRVRPLVFAARGEALTVAVAAWVSEWMPSDEDAASASLMWLGCHDNPHVGELFELLCARLSNVSALPGRSPRPAV